MRGAKCYQKQFNLKHKSLCDDIWYKKQFSIKSPMKLLVHLSFLFPNQYRNPSRVKVSSTGSKKTFVTLVNVVSIAKSRKFRKEEFSSQKNGKMRWWWFDVRQFDTSETVQPYTLWNYLLSWFLWYRIIQAFTPQRFHGDFSWHKAPYHFQCSLWLSTFRPQGTKLNKQNKKFS